MDTDAVPHDADIVPLWGRVKNSDSMQDSPWARKVILCMDGGGVRGYASLLILQKLMQEVRTIEKENSVPSSAHYCWFERNDNRGALYPPWKDEDFRPHHYFDYLVGTSTGGLSAMMLGRLRMPVGEAISHYAIVGKDVFAHPRLIRHPTILTLKYPRYSSRRMEKALQKITQEYRQIERRSFNTQPSGNDNVQRADSPDEQEVKRRAKAVRLRERNIDAPRTVVVAHGGKVSLEALLYRSYDHKPPNESTGGRARDQNGIGEKHWKPWAASDLPLWKIGRATSAAPTYFDPIKIDKEKISDGAMAGANNPVKHAYTEVKQMHWQHEPALIISIGTGIKTEMEDRPQGLLKTFQSSLLQTEKTHEDFRSDIEKINERHFPDLEEEGPEDEDEAGEARSRTNPDRIVYERFNVPERFGLKDVKLGDWRGTKDGPGSETKSKMTEAVESYCLEPNVLSRIHSCAAKMVEIRQRRQETVRWERFALNVVYCCREKQCEKKKFQFESRWKLRNHAVRTHGFVWKVPCMNSAGEMEHPFTCVWEHCAESKVTVFSTVDEFKDHLKAVHKILRPQVKSREQLEIWLDKGRDIHPPKLSRWQATTFGP